MTAPPASPAVAPGIHLAELAALVGGRLSPAGAGSLWATGVRHDSRAVAPGDVFAAIPGARVDGGRFAGAAVAAGAVAVLAERPLEDLDAPVISVPDVRRALGPAAHRVYGRPTDALAAIALTGTDGKTTTTWLLDAALRALGARPALVGTVVSRTPDGADEGATLTTPEADDLARFARRAADAGGTHLILEASSIALALHRPDGMRLAVAGFTNLGRDHLDFHGTLEAYAGAKRRLFTELRPEAAVVNVDDPTGAALAGEIGSGPRVVRVSPTGAAGGADVRFLRGVAGRDGVAADVLLGAPGTAAGRLESPLVGLHNLENLAVAFGVLLALGVAPDAAVAALGQAPAAPGRLERIRRAPVAPAPDPPPSPVDATDPAVFVDYAHTPDALGRVLDAARGLTPGRLLVVFGCGGDRDPGKRAPMAEAAIRRADLALLTNDNPRSEDPDVILDAVEEGARRAGGRHVAADALAGAPKGAGAYLREPDRRLAIRLAVAAAHPGDTVVIAGKGHEAVQIVGDTVHPFDDRAEARAALAARDGGKG